MRIHITHCRSAAYTVTVASQSPNEVSLEPHRLSATTEFMDCLLVKPGVQPGDTILVDLAAAVVDRIASETAAGQIIVDGYNQHPISQVPNSSEPQCSSLTDLSEIVSELTVRLTARGRRVHNTPSGWRKTWESDPYEYPGSQRILEFAIGQEPVIWSAADIDGWSTRCGLLFRP